MMQRVLENIVIYLSLVLRPWALVNMARDYLAANEQLAKTIKVAAEFNQTLRDR
jgi:hypothetical protein